MDKLSVASGWFNGLFNGCASHGVSGWCNNFTCFRVINCACCKKLNKSPLHIPNNILINDNIDSLWDEMDDFEKYEILVNQMPKMEFFNAHYAAAGGFEESLNFILNVADIVYENKDGGAEKIQKIRDSALSGACYKNQLYLIDYMLIYGGAKYCEFCNNETHQQPKSINLRNPSPIDYSKL